MGLAELAAGIEVTDEQEDRGVATVDDTDGDLADGLAAVADDLPCSPGAAATVVETYADGASVGTAGHEAGVAPMTAAKTLHLVGVDGVTPLSPGARRFVADWRDGELTRTEAVELAGVDEREFALGAFVLTHDPLPAAVTAAAGVLAGDGDGPQTGRTALDGAIEDVEVGIDRKG